MPTLRKLSLSIGDFHSKNQNDVSPDVVMSLLGKDSLPVPYDHWQDLIPCRSSSLSFDGHL